MCRVRQCARAWDAAAPAWVCGFSVSRSVAEALLAERQTGAFLIRLCSEPGAFAVSCHVGAGAGGGGSYVDHLLVDSVDLQSRPLEAWVLAHAGASHLLDLASSRLVPKAWPVPVAEYLQAWHAVDRASNGLSQALVTRTQRSSLTWTGALSGVHGADKVVIVCYASRQACRQGM